eukprot:45033-Eustigmatos_ZCMA.PRE.1
MRSRMRICCHGMLCLPQAADYFMPGFWVWAKLIRDMAALGYDHKNMVLMAYDWRLSMPLME